MYRNAAAQAGRLLGGRTESVGVAVGAAALGIGALYFAIRSVRIDGRGRTRLHVAMTLVPTVAFASYASMALGIGVVEVAVNGRGTVELYWARYADWLFTTPLLLLVLGTFVGAEREALFGAIAADAFMIATGVVATLSTLPAYRYAWWGVSAVAFCLVMYFVFVVLTDEARAAGERTASTFVVLRNLTGALWATYPIWWLLGPRGLSVLTPSVTTLGFVALDVLTKVGFGLVLLRSRAVTEGTLALEPTPGRATGSTE